LTNPKKINCLLFYYRATHSMQVSYVQLIFCLSVCLSHLWSVSKRLNISTNFFHSLLDQLL